MKVELLAESCRAAVGLFFIGTGILKLVRPRVLDGALAALRVPSAVRLPASVALALGELLLGVVMIAVAGPVVLLAAGIALAGFSGMLGFLAKRAPQVSCGCLGELGTGAHSLGLVRNALLATLLVAAATAPSNALGVAPLAIGLQLALLVTVATEGLYVIRLVRRTEGRAVHP
ncbi:MAG: hypothetical protein M3321_05820 [Actinomycetota bacterium]|nr:hypothetical protein [Actinomycetota bacterium]